MSNNINKGPIISIIYLWTYSLLLFSSVLRVSNISGRITDPIFLLATFLVIIVNILILIIFNTHKSVLPLILFLIFSIFILIFNSKIMFMQELTFILLCSNINFVNKRSFVKDSIIFTIIPFFIVLALSILKFIPNVSSLPGYNKGNGLGFIDPNNTGEVVIGILCSLFILVSYVYSINKKEFKYMYEYVMIISFIISISVYKITNCRELLYFECIVFVSLLFTNTFVIKKIIYLLMIPIVIGIPSLMIYWDYNYNSANDFYLHIDKLLSERISVQNAIIREYPFKFIQNLNNLDYMKSPNRSINYVVDNSFVDIIEQCGIFGAIIAVLIILRIMALSIRTKLYILSVLILSIVICDCIEASLFYTFLNAPLLYVCLIINQRKQNNLRLKNY